MNQAMWRDQRTQENRNRLEKLGMKILGPGIGDQACGDTGPGRMLEPSELAEHCAKYFKTEELSGRHLVITAGPTREAIDPVRYISNHSSGKMGYALAEAAIEAGASVSLISGPVSLSPPERCELISVTSAQEMLSASLAALDSCNIFIAAAAVADYRPADFAEQKIKKNSEEMEIQLVRNADIVATVSSHDQRPFTVGFAAETEQVVSYARGKLKRKNLDMIVANDVAQEGIGFNSDDNAVTVVTANSELTIPQTSKSQLARRLIALIAEAYENSER